MDAIDRSAAAEVFFREEMHQAHVRRAVDDVWSKLVGGDFVDVHARPALVGRVIVEHSDGAVMKALLKRLAGGDPSAINTWTAGCGLELTPPFSQKWIRSAAYRVAGGSTLGSTRWENLRPKIEETRRLLRLVDEVHDR